SYSGWFRYEHGAFVSTSDDTWVVYRGINDNGLIWGDVGGLGNGVYIEQATDHTDAPYVTVQEAEQMIKDYLGLPDDDYVFLSRINAIDSRNQMHVEASWISRNDASGFGEFGIMLTPEPSTVLLVGVVLGLAALCNCYA